MLIQVARGDHQCMVQVGAMDHHHDLNPTPLLAEAPTLLHTSAPAPKAARH